MLILDFILDIVVLIFLVGLFLGQFRDKLGQLLLNGSRALVVELVIAEVNQDSSQKVFFSTVCFVTDFQPDILRNGFSDLIGIDADGILAGQPKVVGEGTRQFLHKSVDGTHTETAVVVHDAGHQALGVAFQFSIADAQLLHQYRLHRIGLYHSAIDNLAQGVHDFALHLVGGGIGKGDGEDVLVVTHGILVHKTQFQIFLDECESLTRTSRGLVHLKMSVFLHNYQLFSSFLGLIMGCELSTVFFLNILRKLSNERL